MPPAHRVTILSGPTGTELIRRGHDLPDEPWSAVAVEHAPRTIAAIHAEYAAAGAAVHVACTFRTQPRLFPTDYAARTRAAVHLCRSAVPTGHRVLGSLAPVYGCYDPAPPVDAAADQRRHEDMARALVDAGVDGVLCETFPRTDDGLTAARAARALGVPTWLSFTAGPDANLMTPDQLRAAAEQAAKLGVAAVLVNCVSITRIEPYVRALSQALRDGPVAFGAFANAGREDEGFGWHTHAAEEHAASRYADLASKWLDLGASIIGSCCGTSPIHTQALQRRLAHILAPLP